MAYEYTLAEAVTQICATVKDYSEIRFGANDPKSYFRAKHLFWQAMIDLISPSEILKEANPQFYAYAVGLTLDDMQGLCSLSNSEITAGVIDISALTDFYRLLYPDDLLRSIYNDPTISGACTGYIEEIDANIMNAMMGVETAIPTNRVYFFKEKQSIKFVPSDTTGKITILYIKHPDHTVATDTELHTIYSLKLIKTAEQLAALYLNAEIISR